jgi:hypothetical protein
MKKCIALSVLAAISIVSDAHAQQQKMSSSLVNDQGFRITNFNVRASGSGCVGSQDYVKVDAPNDPTSKGTSRMQWSTATKQDGGVLCSNGVWFSGSGPNKGQQGGSTRDVLIKNGAYYR